MYTVNTIHLAVNLADSRLEHQEADIALAADTDSDSLKVDSNFELYHSLDFYKFSGTNVAVSSVPASNLWLSNV